MLALCSHLIVSQAPQNAELVESAGALAAVEALYSFTSDEDTTNGAGGGSRSASSVYERAQQSCIPARFLVDPDFRKTYLVIQVCAKAHEHAPRGCGVLIQCLCSDENL